MLIPKLNNRSKIESLNLSQLETALDKVWQEKWRYRVNIVKNREKLKSDLDDQDYKSTDDKLFKFTLKMDDIRKEEQEFLRLINKYDLPAPNITDELIKEVAFRAFRITLLPLDFEEDIVSFWIELKITSGRIENQLGSIKIIDEISDPPEKLTKKLRTLKSEGRLKLLLEKLETKWWRSNIESFEEKEARFNADYKKLIEAAERITGGSTRGRFSGLS